MRYFHLASAPVPAEQMLHCLMSADVVHELCTTRIFPSSLSPVALSLIEDILLDGAAYPAKNDIEEQEAAAQLVKFGLAVHCKPTPQKETSIEFTAPAVQLAMLARFLRPDPVTHVLSSHLQVSYNDTRPSQPQRAQEHTQPRPRPWPQPRRALCS